MKYPSLEWHEEDETYILEWNGHKLPRLPAETIRPIFDLINRVMGEEFATREAMRQVRAAVDALQETCIRALPMDRT